MIRSVRIFAALYEDAHQGWIWVRGPAHEPRNIIRIKVAGSPTSVYVEALSIDENFIRRYNQPPRRHIPDNIDLVVMSGWYRDRLGIPAGEREVSLSINRTNSLWGQLRACTDHPQLVVRIATWLGILGLALGVLSLALAISVI